MPDLTPIEALDQPALIIDTTRVQIRAANAPAKRIWGLAEAIEMPVALDPDMPALARMQRDARSDGPSELVFWTRNGAQRLRCELQPLADPEAVLVLFEDPRGDGNSEPAGSTATPAGANGGNRINMSAADTDALKPRSANMQAPNMRAMAHELRTPLGAIVALAEMIEHEQLGPVGDPRYRDYARDIGGSAKLTLSIVASALEHDGSVDGILPGGFAELDVAALIEKCLRTTRQAADRAGVELRATFADDLPNLIANAPGLTQILLNLLTNAIKFTPQGGTATVEASIGANGGLIVSVADTGVGMTDIDTSVLIASAAGGQPGGAPAKPPGGIGFLLVRRLAAAMAADLDVTSTRGLGTRVSLTFPPAKVIPVIPASVEV